MSESTQIDLFCKYGLLTVVQIHEISCFNFKREFSAIIWGALKSLQRTAIINFRL